MKIVNVTPGLIPIPPNGWGAVEKIIWEIHQNLLKMGHESVISYLNDIPTDADVVHIHVANLANMAHERGIPYYFTFHDHHAYLYGKNSSVYHENLLAMKNSIRSFVPANYLVEYFENIPQYFSHGVNTEYFTPTTERVSNRLLCVANNGYIENQSMDRKGFGIAIEAAKELNLPITIAGPSNNKKYFDKNPWTYSYVSRKGLSLVYDLSEEELLTLYQTHGIFIHASELEAGHPNLTILEALSCGLPVIGTIEDAVSLGGMTRVTRNVSEVVSTIKDVSSKHNEYSTLARKQAEELSWYNRTKELVKLYEGTEPMKNELLKHYSNTTKLQNYVKPKIAPTPMKHNFHTVDGAFFEITGGDPSTRYHVNFINKKSNTSVYNVELGTNSWARPSLKYYVDWKVVITDLTTNEVVEHHLDLKGKRVLISFESKSLGDTLAWFPYVEEFRKKHGCIMICSTFWNHLFKGQYPHIEFVEPGIEVFNLAALYRVGLFYNGEEIDYDRHPNNAIQAPLQKMASDILGLPYKEIRPLLKLPELDNSESKQISIAVHSTAQAKYWNHPTGWQEVVDWLIERGYKVKLLSKEGDNYMGNRIPNGVVHQPASIETAIEELKKSRLFIGLGSGLTWLSWATNTPTVLISGFSYPWAEMQDCVRVGPPTGKCEGCFNRHKLNPGDWNWCPDYKDTPRQFECSREITPEMVISKLEKIL